MRQPLLTESDPRTIDRPSPLLRRPSLIVIAVIILANAWSVGRLVVGLVAGTDGHGAGPLLLTGTGVWLTNVIVFALWYWRLDRGGLRTGAQADLPYPHFLFAQMGNPDLVPGDWGPTFADYLYLSFTNATAFSPTDVVPLSSWAKLTMMLQAVISLITVIFVIARAVNILK
ncbi:MAG: hypothetical protein ACRDYX_08545 [Egibacteraceae bacterium]